MYTLCTCFLKVCADLHARSVLINKISATELSRKFTKRELLVGKELMPYFLSSSPGEKKRSASLYNEEEGKEKGGKKMDFFSADFQGKNENLWQISSSVT